VRLFAEIPVWGDWDPVRMEQVVTNLISNAVKYGAGKPIEVMVTEVADCRARLSVRDHGIAIPSEHRDRIFERVQREVSSRDYSGLGWGVWIARQIVEAHDGSITVWSEPEQGSIFTVDLPLGLEISLRAGEVARAQPDSGDRDLSCTQDRQDR